MIYDIEPLAKPRMTRRDKWKKRPVVLKYFAFKDQIRLHGVTLPEDGFKVIFRLPMPASWSMKKKTMLQDKPHRSKKDIDNLQKALFDSVYDGEDDGLIWNVWAQKLWSVKGSIEIIPL